MYLLEEVMALEFHYGRAIFPARRALLQPLSAFYRAESCHSPQQRPTEAEAEARTPINMPMQEVLRCYSYASTERDFIQDRQFPPSSPLDGHY